MAFYGGVDVAVGHGTGLGAAIVAAVRGLLQIFPDGALVRRLAEGAEHRQPVGGGHAFDGRDDVAVLAAGNHDRWAPRVLADVAQ